MNDSIGLVAGLVSFVLIVLIYLWASLSLAAVFRKAGEDGWQGWVPLLNTAVLLRLGGFSPWLVFISFVPVLGAIALLVVLVMSYYRINRAFGHGTGMTVVAALFPLIWASILGFGSSRWIGAETAPRRGGYTSGATDAGGPHRSGHNPGLDEAASWPAPSTTAPTVPPVPPTVPSASASTGFWAPPPASAEPVAPPTPVASPAAPSPVVVPPAAPPLPPPPVSFLAPRPDSASRGGVDAQFDPEIDDSAVDPEDRVAPPTLPSSTFLPPPPSPGAGVDADVDAPRRSAPPAAPIESVPVVTPRAAPEPVVPAPVADVPPPPAAPHAPEPWAPAPLRTPAPPAGDDQFPELSEAISAVVGAPDAGAPRSARSSVSALYAQSDLADEEDDIDAMDQTIVARRRRVPWSLIPPGGAPVDISSEVVILGRRPAPDPSRPGAQLIAISDETRTVSKTHARLELRGDTWFVTDLGSTNGVLFATLMGTEVEAQPGQELEAGERFFLGDAEVRLKRSDA
ncbi:DUF5684 domain-containing protein [Microbacterium sp. P07]|uniref:DUF5684 domain-containing protein n=1 Tax=Microbacterium sp. P07 TaxID=3366952 RepID=UPI00374738D8